MCCGNLGAALRLRRQRQGSSRRMWQQMAACLLVHIVMRRRSSLPLRSAGSSGLECKRGTWPAALRFLFPRAAAVPAHRDASPRSLAGGFNLRAQAALLLDQRPDAASTP